MTNAYTNEQFSELCSGIHNKEYTYQKVEYGICTDKVIISCQHHGDFLMRPSYHIQGGKCPGCLLKGREEDFLKLANKLKNNFYDYSQVVYSVNHAHIQIICPIHGKFQSTPARHLNGQDCPCCTQGGGFKKSKKASLYILRSDTFIKVGITNRTVSARLKEIRKSSGIDFEIVSDFIFTDGSIPQKLEQQVLSFMRSKYTSPTDSFGGSTECFLCADTSALMAYLIPLTIH